MKLLEMSLKFRYLTLHLLLHRSSLRLKVQLGLPPSRSLHLGHLAVQLCLYRGQVSSVVFPFPAWVPSVGWVSNEVLLVEQLLHPAVFVLNVLDIFQQRTEPQALVEMSFFFLERTNYIRKLFPTFQQSNLSASSKPWNYFIAIRVGSDWSSPHWPPPGEPRHRCSWGPRRESASCPRWSRGISWSELLIIHSSLINELYEIDWKSFTDLILSRPMLSAKFFHAFCALWCLTYNK